MSSDEDSPAVKRVSIRDYRPAPQIGEGGAFAVSIYLDGKKAGLAENDGSGGCHRYHFDTRANRDAFFAYAEKWATENGKRTGEPADTLIGELCDEYEFTQEAKKLVEGGAAAVLLIEKGPKWFDEEHSGDPDFYEHTYLVGLREGHGPETVAKEQGAHKWRAVPTD